MNYGHLITGPTVSIIASTAIDMGGFAAFMDGEGIGDYSSIYAESPIASIEAELNAEPWERRFSDCEMVIEIAGRQCYASWRRGRPTEEYLEHILDTGHGSVLEHATWVFAIRGVSRSLTHELIRHRAGVGISELSQRFVPASNFNFVPPPLLLRQWAEDESTGGWDAYYADCKRSIDNYCRVRDSIMTHKVTHEGLTETLAKKRALEAARSLLPSATETRLVWTVNARALRHIIALRGDESADLEIRRLAAEIAYAAQAHSPTLFKDVTVSAGDFGVPMVSVKHPKP